MDHRCYIVKIHMSRLARGSPATPAFDSGCDVEQVKASRSRR